MPALVRNNSLIGASVASLTRAMPCSPIWVFDVGTTVAFSLLPSKNNDQVDNFEANQCSYFQPDLLLRLLQLPLVLDCHHRPLQLLLRCVIMLLADHVWQLPPNSPTSQSVRTRRGVHLRPGRWRLANTANLLYGQQSAIVK